ncbi:short-chain dehydrogenase/reductase SDR [Acaromyces ingoldii]|uniref:Short-chain dehydrogenase/reductase SDR n=1 Tax=Acaromyces ingoldii TaxID=215250 RepID=A0A316YQF0_9BASI|nr:short-chain dehydrogenase/reductase SDR [Acaromyces ingoldii]PWN90898.1 short-chain dehydrogenase/reductase SDR [Acaromyces ingoldii]
MTDALPFTKPGVAIVTGASSGIGRAAAISLYQAGWSCVLSGRRDVELQETARRMEAAGLASDSQASICCVCGDLTARGEIERLFNETVKTFGRIDLLFNNAGVGNAKVAMEDIPFEDFQSLLQINVAVPFRCTQLAIKQMKAQVPMGGRIINNGSVSSVTPRPLSAPYTLSKHAITGLTKSTALDGRQHNIACTQLDIGNAQSVMSDSKTGGVLQADGSLRPEPVMDVRYAGHAVAYLASLPLDVNVLNQTIMATTMPFVGRG